MENAEIVEAIVGIEEAEEVEILTVDHHAETETRALRHQDAGHRHAASAISTCLAVAVAEEEIAGTARQIAAHPLAAVLGLHHLVAPAARHLQTVRAHLLDVEDAPSQAIAQDPHHADRGVLPLHDAGEEVLHGTSHGLRATTAEGCPGINRDLLPLKRKQAHQHPGCQGHHPVRRRAAAIAHDQAVHGL